MPVRVVQFGLGSLGAEIARTLQKRTGIELVGVVDIDPNKVGRDAGKLVLRRRLGVKVVGSVDEALRSKPKPEIVLHAATSYLDDLYNQIHPAVARGVSVISTCEQLVYPYTSGANARIAKKLDSLAKKNKASILGVGVNPGFVMDLLALTLTGLCSSVERIRAERVVDVSRRRRALQQKMCLGMSLQEFEAVRKQKGGLGHVGLMESAKMICDALGVKTSFASSVRPLVAERLFTSNDIRIEPGRIAGLEHRLVGKSRRGRFIEMILYMFAGASEFDLIEIDGTPPISVRTDGVQGDQATISLLLNYIPTVLDAEPGLHTVKDLPIPSTSALSYFPA
ncbi:MAG: hypothetical protein ACE5JV_03020 [Nitrososphaerales archaeon]